jgi:hypothetical protein
LPFSRLIELRERQRGAQAEAARALLLCDGDGGPESLLGVGVIAGAALKQNFAFQVKKERVRPAFPGVLGKRQPGIDGRKRAVDATGQGLKFSYQAIVLLREEFVALFEASGQRLPKLFGATLRI